MELTEQKAPFGSEVRRVERFANSAPPSMNTRKYLFYANRQPAWQTRSWTNSAYELPKNDFYYAPRMDTIALKFNICTYIHMHERNVYSLLCRLSKSIAYLLYIDDNHKKYWINALNVQFSYLATLLNFRSFIIVFEYF